MRRWVGALIGVAVVSLALLGCGGLWQVGTVAMRAMTAAGIPWWTPSAIVFVALGALWGAMLSRPPERK